jgi:cytochrome c
MRITLSIITALPLLACAPAFAADAEHGRQLFLQCAACHGDHGQGSDNGPPLVGVVGRKAASIEDFRYSPAMKRSGIVWDDTALGAFINDPQGKVKGTRMPFDGVKDAKDVADLVDYLKGLR